LQEKMPYPPKPLAGKIFLQTITPREVQVLEMPERGVGPLLCPDRGLGYHALKKWSEGWGTSRFCDRGVPLWAGRRGYPHGPGITSG